MFHSLLIYYSSGYSYPSRLNPIFAETQEVN